jgi:hypothetical protein
MKIASSLPQLQSRQWVSQECFKSPAFVSPSLIEHQQVKAQVPEVMM